MTHEQVKDSAILSAQGTTQEKLQEKPFQQEPCYPLPETPREQVQSGDQARLQRKSMRRITRNGH